MMVHLFYGELIVIYLLSLLPWPDLSESKLYCSRDNTSLIRKIVNLKFSSILNKYKVVHFPLECPFHPLRDIFGPHERAKEQNRPSQWTCRLCGKSFFEEYNIDKHINNRHPAHINAGEDAICLADFCDIMRCDVFVLQASKADATSRITDLELWSAQKAFVLNHLYHISGYDDPKKQIFYWEFNEKKEISNEILGGSSPGSNDCQSKKFKDNRGYLFIAKEKDNCSPIKLAKLKRKCEILIRTCIMSLLLEMSDYNYKQLEDELNRAVCWYLSCDRYWEDSPAESRVFPWILIFTFVFTLSLGICLCYYIIWILFDSEEEIKFTQPIKSNKCIEKSISTGTLQYKDKGHTQPIQFNQETCSETQRFHDDALPRSSKDLNAFDHYIYVTYPTNIKRRPLKKCE